MFLRIAVVAPLALAAVLPAQLQPGNPLPGNPTSPVLQGPIKKLTPAEQAAKLTKDKARLEREIEYAKKRVKDAKSLLATKMKRAMPVFKAIDAGKPASAKPLAPQRQPRKFASVGTKEQMDFGGNTMMIMVNDRGISQASYDGVMNYLRESAGGANTNESLLAQRALFDMIRIEAVASQFIENEGEVKHAENLERIASRKLSVKDAAKEFGSVQGAKDGVVTVTRNSIHGPYFEHMAFSTPVGKISRTFRTMNGYTIVEPTAFEKGAKPGLDKVTANVVQFAYTSDPQQMATATFHVNSGQATVLVRDQQVFDMLPALFKPPAPRTSPQQILTKQMTDLMRQHREISKSDPKKAAALQTQIDAIRTRLSEMQRAVIQGTDADMPDSKKTGGTPDASGGKLAPVKAKVKK